MIANEGSPLISSTSSVDTLVSSKLLHTAHPICSNLFKLSFVKQHRKHFLRNNGSSSCQESHGHQTIPVLLNACNGVIRVADYFTKLNSCDTAPREQVLWSSVHVDLPKA
jgi:hypothetical protein